MGSGVEEQDKGANMRRDNYHQRHFEKAMVKLLMYKFPKIFHKWIDNESLSGVSL